MKIFNEMLDWIERNIEQERLLLMNGSTYLYLFKSKVKALQSKYACEDLEKAGY